MRIKIKKGITILLLMVMAMVGVLVPEGDDRAYADVLDTKGKITMFYVLVPNQGNAYGTIDESNKKIVVDVPYGTDVTHLDSRVYTNGVEFLSAVEYRKRLISNYIPEEGDYKILDALYNDPDGLMFNDSDIWYNNVLDKVINDYMNNSMKDFFENTDIKDVDALKKYPDVFEYIQKPLSVGPRDFTHPVMVGIVAPDNRLESYEVTVRVAESKSQEKSITAFGFEGLNTEVTSFIDEANKVITLKVPGGTNVKALVPTFTITGTSLMTNAQSSFLWSVPGSIPHRTFNIPVTIPVKQVSGKTVQDFTNPVQYDVIAADLSTSTYTVTVLKGEEAKKITSYKFVGLNPVVTGVVDEEKHMIKLEVPNGTDIKTLVPTFTTTEGGSVRVGNESQVSGMTAQDFTNPVTYTVEGPDSRTMNYDVIVLTMTEEREKAQEKAITAFSFEGLNPGVTGTVDEKNMTIELTVPYGTDVSALVPTFTIKGTSVTSLELTSRRFVGPLSSGTTALDFREPVFFWVFAADQSVTAAYTVTVKVLKEGEKGKEEQGNASMTLYINGEIKESPTIVNDHAMVPLRMVSEALGAKVDWDADTKTITITSGNTTIGVTIDKDVATVNGTVVPLPEKPFVNELGTSLVPLRFIFEALEAKVDYNEETRAIHVTK